MSNPIKNFIGNMNKTVQPEMGTYLIIEIIIIATQSFLSLFLFFKIIDVKLNFSNIFLLGLIFFIILSFYSIIIIFHCRLRLPGEVLYKLTIYNPKYEHLTDCIVELNFKGIKYISSKPIFEGSQDVKKTNLATIKAGESKSIKIQAYEKLDESVDDIETISCKGKYHGLDEELKDLRISYLDYFKGKIGYLKWIYFLITRNVFLITSRFLLSLGLIFILLYACPPVDLITEPDIIKENVSLGEQVNETISIKNIGMDLKGITIGDLAPGVEPKISRNLRGPQNGEISSNIIKYNIIDDSFTPLALGSIESGKTKFIILSINSTGAQEDRLYNNSIEINAEAQPQNLCSWINIEPRNKEISIPLAIWVERSSQNSENADTSAYNITVEDVSIANFTAPDRSMNA